MKLDLVPLGVLGIRVIEVDDLPSPAILLQSRGLALLDTNLSAQDRQRTLELLADQVLAKAKEVAE